MVKKIAVEAEFDRFYRPEDKAAEISIGELFAKTWGLSYQHHGKKSCFDGLFVDGRGQARFIFELKNRNITSDDYATIPISKNKVESLFNEALKRKIPALLVVHAKVDHHVMWVDVSRLVNLRVTHNSGRTKTPMRGSDIEDCVYIPTVWFQPMDARL